jgi:hypothetical protein
MSENVQPQPSQPTSIFSRITQGIGNYLSVLSDSFSSGAEQATALASKEAENQRESMKPVVSAIGSTASAVSNLASVPAIFGVREAKEILTQSQQVERMSMSAGEALDSPLSLEDKSVVIQADNLENPYVVPKPKPKPRPKAKAKAKKKKKKTSNRFNYVKGKRKARRRR